MSKETEKKVSPQEGGFKQAGEYKPDQQETILNMKVNNLLRLVDFANQQQAPEGWGREVNIQVGDVAIGYKFTPPQAVYRRDGYGGGAAKPTFSKEAVQAVVQENADMLTYQEADGKAQVYPKKFLGDLWNGLNDKLKASGMRWGASATINGKEVKGWGQA